MPCSIIERIERAQGCRTCLQSQDRDPERNEGENREAEKRLGIFSGARWLALHGISENYITLQSRLIPLKADASLPYLITRIAQVELLAWAFRVFWGREILLDFLSVIIYYNYVGRIYS